MSLFFFFTFQLADIQYYKFQVCSIVLEDFGDTFKSDCDYELDHSNIHAMSGSGICSVSSNHVLYFLVCLAIFFS